MSCVSFTVLYVFVIQMGHIGSRLNPEFSLYCIAYVQLFKGCTVAYLKSALAYIKVFTCQSVVVYVVYGCLHCGWLAVCVF